MLDPLLANFQNAQAQAQLYQMQQQQLQLQQPQQFTQHPSAYSHPHGGYVSAPHAIHPASGSSTQEDQMMDIDPY